jgi:hypothetical protein
MRAKHPPGFLNVDLEIVSRSKLDALEAAVSATAHALYCGPVRKGIFLLSLECNVYPKDADAAISRLCAAIDRLGKSERRIWEQALERTFDVGYSLTDKALAVRVVLRPETLERIVAIGGTVAFTCYRDAYGTNPIRSTGKTTSSAAGSRR